MTAKQKLAAFALQAAYRHLVKVSHEMSAVIDKPAAFAEVGARMVTLLTNIIYLKKEVGEDTDVEEYYVRRTKLLTEQAAREAALSVVHLN